MLKLIHRMRGYKLNAGALNVLQEIVPNQVLEILSELKDKHYSSREKFFSAIQAIRGGVSLDAYMNNILNEARVFQIRRLTCYIRWYLSMFFPRYFPKSRLLPSIYRYVLLQPLVLSLTLRIRWLFFFCLAQLRRQPRVLEANNTNVNGFIHNYKQILSFEYGHRNRTESLMSVMKTIQDIDFKKSKVLCVGPRNEGEVLLLRYYGLSSHNVEAIDLFSYSPLIKVMDMNDLKYEDNSFDIYYSSAVIKYSPNIALTIAESIRVTKPGGLMVYGFMFGEKTNIIPDGSELQDGIKELLSFYEGHVEHIFWQEEFVCSPKDIRATLIFRLKK
ncbi:Methyltransferase domain [Legionella lansingensis]|uniref:Methyltransferase type 11 domain-containing protein n=1 Tax=Legionella lansingensis TaxID=45067 RepID=A0A0W0VW70_9GAMM|nr:methyltransferase domain-containing protein [Legionella lansingensis]KTD24319.1 hypothetical protein Llan_0458 [Legionella lansingensis]SNV51808.1 Methyltransferase domain [Legionella lansingensis]